MYIETKSADELTKLVREKGYSSLEAEEIRKEMEQAKEKYDFLISRQEIMNECGCEIAAIVVEYYLTYLGRLRQAIPYDAMGSQISILIMSLQEFSRKDIAEKICAWKEVNLLERVDELKHEIQKFKIVQLDPKGILLYMDILRGEVAV